jgi:NAD(P)-dependent dehydrogenase (short-subunit alcohol dehydrogenase family)
MTGRLNNHVAIITGATSGIGYRTAEMFVEQGAKVLLSARREDKGNELAERLGDNAHFVRADVTQEADVEAMVAAAVDRWGRVDSLFNNASSGSPGNPVDELSFHDFQTAMDLQAGSVFLGIKHIVPVMKKQGGGSIINNASIAGVGVGYGSMLYSAGKAAVIHMTRCLAIELGEYGIRLNCISPGGVMTPIFLGPAQDNLTTEQTQAAVDRLAAVYDEHIPTRRAGLPDDIGHAAVFLATNESQHITGENMVVDAGTSLGRNKQYQAQWNAWRREAMFGQS